MFFLSINTFIYFMYITFWDKIRKNRYGKQMHKKRKRREKTDINTDRQKEKNKETPKIYNTINNKEKC